MPPCMEEEKRDMMVTETFIIMSYDFQSAGKVNGSYIKEIW